MFLTTGMNGVRLRLGALPVTRPLELSEQAVSEPPQVLCAGSPFPRTDSVDIE